MFLQGGFFSKSFLPINHVRLLHWSIVFKNKKGLKKKFVTQNYKGECRSEFLHKRSPFLNDPNRAAAEDMRHSGAR